jgi:hypothetical protein
LGEDFGGAQNGAVNGAVNEGGRREAVPWEQMLALQSQIVALHDATNGQSTGARKFQILNGNFRRFSMQPVARRANNQEAGAAAEPNQAACASMLRPNPRAVCDLWDEHENGIHVSLRVKRERE